MTAETKNEMKKYIYFLHFHFHEDFCRKVKCYALFKDDCENFDIFSENFDKFSNSLLIFATKSKRSQSLNCC